MSGELVIILTPLAVFSTPGPEAHSCGLLRRDDVCLLIAEANGCFLLLSGHGELGWGLGFFSVVNPASATR